MSDDRVIKGYFLRVSDEGVQFKGYITEFTDTLEYLQDYVGGYIDIVSLNSDIDLVINDEGKIHQLPTNRARIGGNGRVADFICGNILCLRHDSDGNFESILESDIPKIEKSLLPLMSVNIVDNNIIYTMINADVLPEYDSEQ